MIGSYELNELLSKYGVDAKKVVSKNDNVLTYGEYQEIKNVLEFLVRECGISPRNIEKCPSILYLKIEAIKENWEFLNEKKINTRDVETCLHILSTDPEQLKKTYEYVSDENRYGKKYIEQITTILRVPVERIQEIEEKCPKLTKENKLSAAKSGKNVDEINYYIKICVQRNLNVKSLKNAIQYNEYERLSEKTKNKLITNEKLKLPDLVQAR